MKKVISLILVAVMLLATLTSCSITRQNERLKTAEEQVGKAIDKYREYYSENPKSFALYDSAIYFDFTSDDTKDYAIFFVCSEETSEKKTVKNLVSYCKGNFDNLSFMSDVGNIKIEQFKYRKVDDYNSLSTEEEIVQKAVKEYRRTRKFPNVFLVGSEVTSIELYSKEGIVGSIVFFTCTRGSSNNNVKNEIVMCTYDQTLLTADFEVIPIDDPNLSILSVDLEEIADDMFCKYYS